MQKLGDVWYGCKYYLHGSEKFLIYNGIGAYDSFVSSIFSSAVKLTL